MGRRERSALSRFRQGGHAWWETAISDIQPGRIVIRGERIEHLVESMSYAGVVGLMVGNLRLSNPQARLLEAALIAGVDHGARAPSIAAARMAATCGVPLNCAVATGINLLGDDHGGAGEQCMELLYEAAARSAVDATSLASVATTLIAERLRSDEKIPGFGHQLHKDEDPRRSPMLRLIDGAIAAGEIKGSFARAGLALEVALAQAKGRTLGLNVDGVTAIVYCELGLPPAAAKGLFCLSRGVGIVAHALEEMQSGARIKGPCPPGDDLVKYVGPAETT
ncbi:MAG: citryl-CoA lyase [Chloroflexi bacterium]|nr:MAG: citryl-CoA lyase [Chloroflexota bacterium]TME89494.1 MAG: citryl-CoA lyase [Chloroflexota bacterium]